MRKNIFTLFLLLIINQSYAQQDKFQIGILAGLNFSELEGESLGDYFGLNTGLKSTYRFSKNWQFSAEILYSENGEYILPDFYPENVEYGKISLKHVEIPWHFDVLIDLFKKNDYVDWHLEFGFAYTKLLNYRAENQFGDRVDDQFVYGKKDAWQHQIGMTYFFSSRFGLNSRISIPLSFSGLTPTLSARLVYFI